MTMITVTSVALFRLAVNMKMVNEIEDGIYENRNSNRKLYKLTFIVPDTVKKTKQKTLTSSAVSCSGVLLPALLH